MHFEVLVEDQSGKAMLDILLKKPIDKPHTFEVKSYKGIGHIPGNFTSSSDASKRLLLNQLPRLLGGYGKAFAGYPENYSAAPHMDVENNASPSFRYFREKVRGLAGAVV